MLPAQNIYTPGYPYLGCIMGTPHGGIYPSLRQQRGGPRAAFVELLVEWASRRDCCFVEGSIGAGLSRSAPDNGTAPIESSAIARRTI